MLAVILPYPGPLPRGADRGGVHRRGRSAGWSGAFPALARLAAMLDARAGEAAARARRPTPGVFPAIGAAQAAASRCCAAARSRCSTPASTRRRSACSPAAASRWCWPRARAAAARSSTTWAAADEAHARGAQQHRRLDARDRRGRPRRHPRHHVGLRHDDQGLRLHVPQRSGLRRQGRARLARWRRTSPNIWRRSTSARRASTPGLDRRLSLRLLAAARPADQDRRRRRCWRAPASPCASRPRRTSAAARPAPTTCCSRRSPARLRDAQGRRTSRRPAPTSSPPATSAASIQIGAAIDMPVVHTVELLDWAYGGPKPAQLERA